MVQFDCIEKPLSRLFNVYGRFIARHPVWFLIGPLLLTAALGSGFYFFKSEYDVENLFSPEGARSKDERSVMQALFNDSERSTDFSANRMTTLGEYGRMIVTAKEADGNVLTSDVLQEVEELDYDIRNMIVEVSGKTYNYTELCAGSCENATNALLKLKGTLNFDPSLVTYPVHPLPSGERVFIGSTLGGVTTDGTNIKKAKAWSLFYYLRSDNNYTDIVKKWQEQFLSTLAERSNSHINITRFTAHSLEDELKRNSDAVFPLFSILFTVLITFSIVSCMSADWVRSKPWLGNLGVLSAGLAVVSGFGLVLLIGVPFIDIVASSPFLVLGIGVDDMFVMLAAWRQTDFRWSVEERMGKAFSEAALSITITSLTDALSIGIGAITKFRSVRIFCTYTAIAVLFDYFYQITFFAACMVITGHREAGNRHPATCMKAVPKSKAGNRSAIFRFFCTGGYTEVEAIDTSKTADVKAMIFFRDSWGKLLSTRPFKIFLIHVYLVYLGFAIWGCLNVNEGITLDRLAGDDSYVADYYDDDIKYFREYGPVVGVKVGKEMELWDKTNQNKFDDLIKKFEASEYFHDNNVTTAWIRDFSDFRDNVNSGNFTEVLDQFLLDRRFHKYNQDIETDSDKVKYSRFFVVSKNVVTSIRESKMMLAARDIADTHDDLDITVFHPAFIFYDQYIAVWPNTRQNLLIATAAMFLVSLFLIPHPVCSLWVTFSIVSICTGVIGYMTWWDVNLDTISMINIIICIGFCVDFSAHITYAFVSADGETGNQRMRNALHALGYPIAQGALSTILGVSALAFSNSYIFRTFFKTMFLVILLGAFHGLLIIPALLSLMGPPKMKRKRHSVAPMDDAVADGVSGWIKRDLDTVVPDYGAGAPVGHQDEFPPTLPVRPRKTGSPMRYCNIPNKPRNGDNGRRTNPAPMPYANGDLPPRYETSERYDRPTGRSLDPYNGPRPYNPPMTNLGRPQDDYPGPYDYRPPLSDIGRPGGNYSRGQGYGTGMSDAGPPQYRVGSPGGHQMSMPNGWRQY